MEVPKNKNGNYYTCSLCKKEIEDDYAEMSTSLEGVTATVHGECLKAFIREVQS